MITQRLSAGIMAVLAETRESLSAHIASTQLADVKISLDEYCAEEDDYPTQRFLEAQPEIVLIDMHDQRAAIKAIYTLHTVMPDVWIYACGAPNDPQLIIEAMQAGAREFLSKPISSRSLSMAFTRFIEERDRLRTVSKPRGKIYCVTAAKGGSGATSVAVNIAATLAEAPETRVAILDLNCPVGDASAYLNLRPQFSLSDAVSAVARLDSVLLETLMTSAGKVALLPGPKNSKAHSISPSSMAKLLRVAASTYSHVFVDTPYSLEQDLFQTTADACEAILLVMTPELPAIWRTHRLLSLLASYGCGDRLKLILNRDNSRDEITDKEITRALSHPIFFRLPNNYSVAVQAINRGKPIVEVNHSSLAASYRQFTQELTGIAFQKPKRGFAKLFSR
jgi:pilus assembly protein CpaE